MTPPTGVGGYRRESGKGTSDRSASHRRGGSRQLPSAAARIKLFCTSSLDRYFDFVDECPKILDRCASIDVGRIERDEFGRHVLRCHEELAEMGGREAPAFRAIAERLAKELGND